MDNWLVDVVSIEQLIASIELNAFVLVIISAGEEYSRLWTTCRSGWSEVAGEYRVVRKLKKSPVVVFYLGKHYQNRAWRGQQTVIVA